MIKNLIMPVLVLLIASYGGLANGYESMEVKNGATIKGAVRFSGSIPPNEIITIDRNKRDCGEQQTLDKYIVAGSRVKNAVAFIENPERGKPLPEARTLSLTIKGCKVEPLVSIGFVGGKFLFRNDDDILHTLQLKLWLEYQRKVSTRPLKEGATIYNLAFPKKGMEIEKPIKGFHRYREETGVIRVTSNTHPWMRGFVLIFDHPYAALTNDEGVFVMENLPPGDYLLKVWHEGFGLLERPVHVEPDEVLEVEVEFTP